MRALVYLDRKYVENLNKILPTNIEAEPNYRSSAYIFSLNIDEPMENKERVRQRVVEFFETSGLPVTLRIFKV